MPSFDFTLVLRSSPTDAQLDALFEAGCSDATFGTIDGVSQADFTREAPTFEDAARAAIAAVQSVGLAVAQLRFGGNSRPSD